MNRRGFIKAIFGAAAAVVAAPVLALLPKAKGEGIVTGLGHNFYDLKAHATPTLVRFTPVPGQDFRQIDKVEQELERIWANYSVTPTHMMMSDTVAQHLIEQGYDPALFTADENGVYYLGGAREIGIERGVKFREIPAWAAMS